MDRTTSEESWLHQKTQTGFTDTPGLTLTPWLLRVCSKTVLKLCAKHVLALNLLSTNNQQSGNCSGGCGWATCFPSAGQSKCEAAGWKLGRFHYCCRVAATEPAAVVFAGYEIIHISPSLRSGEIRHYFFAADYLRLPKFSLTNWCIFRENTTKFPQFVGVWFYG